MLENWLQSVQLINDGCMSNKCCGGSHMTSSCHFRFFQSTSIAPPVSCVLAHSFCTLYSSAQPAFVPLIEFQLGCFHFGFYNVFPFPLSGLATSFFLCLNNYFTVLRTFFSRFNSPWTSLKELHQTSSGWNVPKISLKEPECPLGDIFGTY